CSCTSSTLFSSSTCPSPPDISTLSLHDALPIFSIKVKNIIHCGMFERFITRIFKFAGPSKVKHAISIYFGDFCCVVSRSCVDNRSEEHTSELQSRFDLVCRLLLEKKKSNNRTDR